MDCRKFHKNFEDYLEDGLDFAGRFGMERHAQQCIACGKDMANAQRLRQMVGELDRVKAPVDFESSVLHRIGNRRTRFQGLRRFWWYGFEFPSPRKLVFASSCLTAALALGVFYFHPQVFRRNHPEVVSSPRLISPETPKLDSPVAAPTAIAAAAVNTRRPQREAPGWTEPKEAAPPPVLEKEQIAEEEITENDYVELQWIGPDNRPVSIRYPNKPHTRYGQDYFIRNISH